MINIIFCKNPVSLRDTFFSGQSFRWKKHSDNDSVFVSVMHDTPVVFMQRDSGILRIDSPRETIDGTGVTEWVKNYLSLDIDNSMLFDHDFRNRYPEIMQLVDDFEGLKLLRQDPFETAVTFMCAQGIGMPLIRRQVALLCERFGRPFIVETEGMRHVLYSFPSPDRLAGVPAEALRLCTNNNCRRAVNIRRMAGAVADGKLDFRRLAASGMQIELIREELCRFDGIGPKIADCIALFGLGRFDAFPIDTHVRQYLAGWFGLHRAEMTLTEKNYLRLQGEVRSILKPELAGYAGHLLFHCWRRKVKGLLTA
ncbi:MAG: DNA-3-methyladenine glycosylase 2 family protein [Chlorobi bacterium]|nr:DNA-3-methyladenine glycosylase 2 family protein [Chlorobiota bacterium]